MNNKAYNRNGKFGGNRGAMKDKAKNSNSVVKRETGAMKEKAIYRNVDIGGNRRANNDTAKNSNSDVKGDTRAMKGKSNRNVNVDVNTRGVIDTGKNSHWKTGPCQICGETTVCCCEVCGDYYCSPRCHLIDWPSHRYICFPMPPLIPFKQFKAMRQTDEPPDALENAESSTAK